MAAWETVGEQDIENDQADHKFDLSTLFNLAPRGGKSYGSGYDDTGSLTTFATGCFRLTCHIGTFVNQNFEVFEVEDEESAELPVTNIPHSTTGDASNVSDITSESPSGSLTGSASVASAPAGLEAKSSSPTNSTHSLSGDEQSHTASVAASTRKMGVNSSND